MTGFFVERVLRALHAAMGLPFEPLTPNETTIAAMREARAGHLKRFDSVEALMTRCATSPAVEGGEG